MNALNSVEFQKFKSESKLMDSSFVNIKIPETQTQTENSMESSAQNSNLENTENLPRNGNAFLTVGGKPCELKLILLVFASALVFSAILVALFTPTSGLGFVEKSEEDSVTVYFRYPNGTTVLKSPLPHSEHQLQHPQNPTELEDVDANVDASAIREKVKEIPKETSSGISQVKRQLEAQNENIQEVRKTVGDLGGQITHLHGNSSKEMNSLRDELKQEISLLKDEMKSLLLNFKSNSSAPPTPTPTLSTPRFYKDPNYKGVWFLPTPGWGKKCVDMPSYFENAASSVNLGGHCLLICPGKGCGSQWVGLVRSRHLKVCEEVDPNSYGLADFTNIPFDNEIRSFRLCQKKT